MHRQQFIELIQSVLASAQLERQVETLNLLFKILYTYSNSVFENLKNSFSHIQLILNVSYRDNTFQHEQIERILKSLEEKMIVGENIMKRSVTNLIAVKFRKDRQISKQLCSELVQLTQKEISSRIAKFILDQKGNQVISSIKHDLAQAHDSILIEIASHF